MDVLSLMIAVAYLLVPTFKVCTAIDSIHVSESISDGSNTLVSQDGKYELGFFSPGNSNKRYLGIWYKNIPVQRVVWVANRLNPINDSSGILTLNSTGNLVLSQNDTVVWYTTSKKQAGNSVAVLLNTGNFALRSEEEANPEGYLWQSFDYPSDTFLAGMKLGWDLRTDLEWRLTSWKNPNDPSPGEFCRTLVLSNYPEFYLMNGTRKFFRFGPWNGLYLSGVPSSLINRYKIVSDMKFISNKDEIYSTYNFFNDSVINIGVINQTTYSYYRLQWNESAKTWKHFLAYPQDMCDKYGICGANANCRLLESPTCQCLKGFSPKSPQAWNSSDWTKGCVPNKPIGCNNKNYKSNESFAKLLGMKVPDTTHTWLDGNVDLEECKVKCLNNCSCMAYSNSDIRGEGSGCVMWFGDLIDLKQLQQGGQDLYIRTDASELEPQTGSNKNRTTEVASKKTKRTILIAAIPAICLMLLICTIYFIHRVLRNDAEKAKSKDDTELETHVDVQDLPLFELQTITTAASHFSIENKIGEGGFGPVYKGKLADGQEIAVKRLSRSSGQGINEFLNEVKLIVKLQHRNLVRLLGCCIQGHERLLVYEYMANGSLDSFIFDPTKGKLLQWPKRFHIIYGIARGILYLHQDSRLRIIHRDLKASNVLLDDELNPKISDFGMAKAFGGDQIEGNTNRVVGTYGYMAPEYAVEGLFSIKSDVFSFGVLLLEIISGSKNRALYHATDTLNLVGYAWTLWKEDKALQLIDSNVRDSCIASEVLRCIHVSLLCVQQYPEDRPNMTLALRMLENEMELVEPKEPGFFPRKVSNEADLLNKQKEMSSNDELTITSLSGR